METRSYAFDLKDIMKGKFNYGWEQETLWKMTEKKKVKNYKMKDISHWIYHPCWSEKDCFISIFQVINQKNKFKEHIKRIKKADLKYPLIIMEDPYDKKGSILDGNHRFAKAILEERNNIEVYYFTKKELEKLKIKL